jgi:tetratricopeptide (TPR) repeat protein
MILARGEASRRQALGYLLAFALCCALPILPITARNYLVADDLVLVSSQAGVNFYIGNNPKSDGMTAIVPGTPGTWRGGYDAAIERAEQARGRALKASEASAYYFGEAWNFARAQPGRYAALNARKLALFWSHWEIPNNKILYFWTDRFTPVVRFLPLGFGVIGPLGLLGAALCWRRRRETFPLWGFLLVYMASVVVFFCNARYRVPVLPILILLGSHAIVWVADALRARRYSDSLLAGLGFVAALTFVNLVPQHPMWRERPMSHFRLANGYLVTGQPQRAIESYAAVLALEPGHLIARHNLARTLLQVGRTEDALEQLQRVLRAAERRPEVLSRENRARAHEDLADALKRLGRDAEASAALADPVGSVE